MTMPSPVSTACGARRAVTEIVHEICNPLVAEDFPFSCRPSAA
jgi:hypothetical protein